MRLRTRSSPRSALELSRVEMLPARSSIGQGRAWTLNNHVPGAVDESGLTESHRLAAFALAIAGQDEKRVLWNQQAMGMVCYRMQKCAEALRWLRETREIDDEYGKVLGELFLAMTYHQLGDSTNAHQALGRAERLMAASRAWVLSG